jgi:hypothetical protein
MNWIIPGVLGAFSTPIDVKYSLKGLSEGLNPEKIAEKMQKIGIKSIIRLNERMYDERVFEKRGIRVVGMEFPDGSVPGWGTVEKFI